MILFLQEVVLDLLQSIVEIVTYGDRHDPAIFELETLHRPSFLDPLNVDML